MYFSERLSYPFSGTEPDILTFLMLLLLFIFFVFPFSFSWLSFPFFTSWSVDKDFVTNMYNNSWLLTLKLLSISVSMHCWSCVIGESVYSYGDFHCHVCIWSIKLYRRIVIFIWTSIVWLMFVGHFYIITTHKKTQGKRNIYIKNNHRLLKCFQFIIKLNTSFIDSLPIERLRIDVICFILLLQYQFTIQWKS